MMPWGFSLTVLDKCEHMWATLHFDTDRYEPAPAHRFVAAYLAVLRAVTPTQTGFVPGYYTPPGWGYNTLAGPVAWPGTYTPPAVVQSSPGQFLRLPDGKVWNPTTGTFYSPWFNTFSGANGTYYPNPWTGTYVNPLNGASFDPWANTVTRPWLWGTSVFGNPWGY